jgi:aspartyl-tRNA(Asn)/glutamyl-tRNA(Gln) amidotransferase subunit B
MDTGALDAIVDRVIAENQAEVEKFRGGEQKVFGVLVAKAKEAGADPGAASKLLRSKLQSQ